MLSLPEVATGLRWQDILTVLGCIQQPVRLPARLTCPVCRRQQSLLVYEDSTSAGAGHHCSGCGSVGSLIDLAAAAWRVAPATALQQLLKRTGLSPERITRAVKRWPESDESRARAL